MGGTFYQIDGAAITVKDFDQLPEGMYPDDVVAEISEVIDKAVAKWYKQRGKDFLYCEPT